MASALTVVSCVAKLKEPLCGLLLSIVSWQSCVIVLKTPVRFLHVELHQALLQAEVR